MSLLVVKNTRVARDTTPKISKNPNVKLLYLVFHLVLVLLFFLLLVVRLVLGPR